MFLNTLQQSSLEGQSERKYLWRFLTVEEKKKKKSQDVGGIFCSLVLVRTFWATVIRTVQIFGLFLMRFVCFSSLLSLTNFVYIRCLICVEMNPTWHTITHKARGHGIPSSQNNLFQIGSCILFDGAEKKAQRYFCNISKHKICSIELQSAWKNVNVWDYFITSVATLNMPAC